MIARLVSAAVLVCLLAFGALAGAQGCDRVLDGPLNVRSGPSLAFGVVGSVDEGDCLDVLDYVDNGDEAYSQWYQIEAGWVWSGAVVLDDVAVVLTPEVVPTVPPAVRQALACEWVLEVRYVSAAYRVSIERCV